MAGKYKDYILGSGELEFAKSSVAGAPPLGTAAYRYLGNSPSVSQAQSATSLDHFDADHGLKQKDDSVILQLDRTGKFKLDSNDSKNLCLFYFAEETTLAQAAQTGVAETLDASPGARVQLGTSVNPSGLRGISNLVVKDHTTPTTTYAAGTDYLLDADSGRISYPDGTTIPDGGKVDVTFDAESASRIQIVSSADALIEGSLRFKATNPKGTKYDYFWPYVQLSPDGDYNLKGDTWAEMNFNMSINAPGDGRAAMYIDGQPNFI